MRHYSSPPVISANLILKLNINKMIIDIRATSAEFRSDLSNLDSFLSRCSSNIETFNNHVNHEVDSFQAREERVDDLLTNIFKEYKVASNIKFVSSIDLWERSWIQGDDIKSDFLMTKSLNGYNVKVLRKTWRQ